MFTRSSIYIPCNHTNLALTCFRSTEQYKECLAGGNAVPPVSPLNMSNQLTELESKIQELKSFGENLAVTLESAAVCFLPMENTLIPQIINFIVLFKSRSIQLQGNTD